MESEGKGSGGGLKSYGNVEARQYEHKRNFHYIILAWKFQAASFYERSSSFHSVWFTIHIKMFSLSRGVESVGVNFYAFSYVGGMIQSDVT